MYVSNVYVYLQFLYTPAMYIYVSNGIEDSLRFTYISTVYMSAMCINVFNVYISFQYKHISVICIYDFNVYMCIYYLYMSQMWMYVSDVYIGL